MPHSEALHEAKIIADGAERALVDHLRPAFEAVTDLYAQRLKDVAVQEPWAADKLRALALAQQIAEAVRGQIEAKVTGGDVAENELRRLRKIESMSPERRKVLGFTI